MTRDAVLAALRPRSFRERLRTHTFGGWSVRQVTQRLPLDAWGPTSSSEPEIVRERRQIEEVRNVLLGLVSEGRVRRQASSYGTQIVAKGGREVIVDVFRLA